MRHLFCNLSECTEASSGYWSEKHGVGTRVCPGGTRTFQVSQGRAANSHCGYPPGGRRSEATVARGRRELAASFISDQLWYFARGLLGRRIARRPRALAAHAAMMLSV